MGLTIPVLGDNGVAQDINLLVTTLEPAVLRPCLGKARAVLFLLQDLAHIVGCGAGLRLRVGGELSALSKLFSVCTRGLGMFASRVHDNVVRARR